MAVLEEPVPAAGERGVVRWGAAALSLLGGLLVAIPALPLCAVIATVTLHVTAGTTADPVGFGLLGGIVGWLIAGAVAAGYSSRARANSAVYSELTARFQALDIELQAAEARFGRSTPPSATAGPTAASEYFDPGAFTEIEEHVKALAPDLGGAARDSIPAQKREEKS
jgi:hypothetical protein